MAHQVFGAPVRRVIHHDGDNVELAIKQEEDPFVSAPHQQGIIYPSATSTTSISAFEPHAYDSSTSAYYDDIPIEEEYGEEEETIELVDDNQEFRETSPVIDVGLPHEHYTYASEYQQRNYPVIQQINSITLRFQPRSVTYARQNQPTTYVQKVQSHVPHGNIAGRMNNSLTIVYRPQVQQPKVSNASKFSISARQSALDAVRRPREAHLQMHELPLRDDERQHDHDARGEMRPAALHARPAPTVRSSIFDAVV